MSKSITVNYDGKPKYNILIEKDFSRLNEYIDSLGFSNKKICIITDSNIADIFLDELKESLPNKKLYTHTIPAGEANKNLNTVKDIYTTLVKNNFERGDLLIALGGGVVGDICGFTAATYLRGISFIQIPTSLLAQVDSSIGGKTGVDFDSYKNMVGAFYMPALVYINVSTLLSLPDSEFISGMGEVVKHGLILDFDYYKWIVSNAADIKIRNLDALEYMIYQSDIIKASVVEEDPFEKGRRRLLNFGHTLGHAIEKEYNLKLSHGICVALGMLCAIYISAGKGYARMSDYDDVKALLLDFNFPVSISDISIDKIIEDTKNDKKMVDGHIKFILIKAIGDAFVSDDTSLDDMRGALEYIYDR